MAQGRLHEALEDFRVAVRLARSERWSAPSADATRIGAEGILDQVDSDLIEAGKPVAEIAEQLGLTAQTVYNWRNQDEIDRGLRAGLSTGESAELTAAKKRIRELESELGVTKRVNELLKAQTDPKGAGRSSPKS